MLIDPENIKLWHNTQTENKKSGRKYFRYDFSNRHFQDSLQSKVCLCQPSLHKTDKGRGLNPQVSRRRQQLYELSCEGPQGTGHVGRGEDNVVYQPFASKDLSMVLPPEHIQQAEQDRFEREEDEALQ